MRHFLRTTLQGLAMVAISVAVINVGYLFEGTGHALGRYEFVSAALTRPVSQGEWRPSSADELVDAAYRFRVNRFRGTWLGDLPMPLPKHYLLGFDIQKFEAEGVPEKFVNPKAVGNEIMGYPVYLDGVVSQRSWWYYYLLALAYKLPEGTLLLVGASLVVLFGSPRARAPWFDECVVLAVPVVVLGVMSAFTNINLGLRYVLPIFPYVFISTGKLVPWAAGIADRRRRWGAEFFVGASLAATVAASLAIGPHYLAYFNWASGGPGNGSKHLIDSNLDWGQDLVGLRRWVRANAEGERIGIAYFGQVHPNIFRYRAEGPFNWFVPPPLPGAKHMGDLPPRYRGGTWGRRLEPGLYAVSASLVRGLPWRVYDDETEYHENWWSPRSAWVGAFGYFADLEPFAKIGDSIFLYRVTPVQSARLAHYWERGKPRRD